MKHASAFFYFAFILSVPLLTSCTKDSLIPNTPPCPSCRVGNITPIIALDTTLYFIDSSWIKQETGTYISDISPILNQLGISPGKVFHINLIIGTTAISIFPDLQANFMGGTIYGSVFRQNNQEACTITFAYLAQDLHYGEAPHGGSLPFSSIEIEVVSLN